jgi:hypothetical protein
MTKTYLNLTPRQLDIIKWIGEQYAVRMDHIQILLGRTATQKTKEDGVASVTLTRKIVLNSWEKNGLVQYTKFFYNKPAWVWLSGRGLYHAGLPFRSREPSIQYLNHYHYINSVRLLLETKGIESWVSERHLRHSLESNLHTQKGMPHNGKKPHLPDAIVTYDGNEVAIEVELTRKSDSILDAILRDLEQRYQYIWYFTSGSIKSVLEGKINNNPKFVLYDLVDMLKDIRTEKAGE